MESSTRHVGQTACPQPRSRSVAGAPSRSLRYLGSAYPGLPSWANLRRPSGPRSSLDFSCYVRATSSNNKRIKKSGCSETPEQPVVKVPRGGGKLYRACVTRQREWWKPSVSRRCWSSGGYQRAGSWPGRWCWRWTPPAYLYPIQSRRSCAPAPRTSAPGTG